ncbi:MAG: DNA-directed RNA polymerase subunit beta, partial [Bacteriovoracaceae bacterium]
MRLQIKSYEDFLQREIPPARREDKGLQAVFKSVFPIFDFNKTVSLEFVSYSLEEPKYSEQECKARGLSFESPLKVTVRLVFFDIDEEDEENRTISSIKEQEVYLGNIPLMTDTGQFVYNGTERVIVSQLHRSPGIIFEHDSGKKHSSGKLLYSSRIIPHRGSWLDFEFDHKNVLYARIDRKRKLHATVILKALGFSVSELLNLFYEKETLHLSQKKFERELDFSLMQGARAEEDILDPKSGKPIVKKGKKITKVHVKKLNEAKVKKLPATLEEIVGKVVADDVYDEETGEVIASANEALTEQKIYDLINSGVKTLEVLYIDNVNYSDQMRNTLLLDKTNSTEEALIKIFERLRPGEPPTLETSQALFDSLFFDETRYDLSKVGRFRMNKRFEQELDLENKENRILRLEDVVNLMKEIIRLNNDPHAEPDNIDHLGNRRVKTLGELLQDRLRIAFTRMERIIKDRMSTSDVEIVMPAQLINARPLVAALKE